MKNVLEFLKENNIGYWVVLMTCILSIVYFGNKSYTEGKSLDGISVVTSALIFIATTLINFKWGSSKGSQDKQDIINNSLK